MKGILKSAFGVCLLVYSLLACGYSIVLLWLGKGAALAAWGLLLASAPIVVYMLIRYRFAGKPRSEVELAVAAASGLGLAVTLAASFRFGPTAGIAHIWAALGFALWFAWIKTRVGRTE